MGCGAGTKEGKLASDERKDVELPSKPPEGDVELPSKTPDGIDSAAGLSVPIEPLTERRKSSLQTTPLKSPPEGGMSQKVEGQTEVSFVVDCGSGHTKLYCYRREGEDIREKSGRLGSGVILNDVLAEGEDGPAREVFLAKCEEVGEMDKEPTAPFFLGATGGVRRAIETGTVTEENWLAFGEMMRKRWPTRRVEQVILSGTEEALRELIAVRTLAAPMISRTNRGSKTFKDLAATAPEALDAGHVGLISGGGESCQIAWGTGDAMRVETARLSTVEAMKRIKEDEAAGWTWWEEHLKECRGQMNDWPERGLTGTFIGTSLQGTIGKLSGCGGRYVTQPEAYAAVSKLVEDLRAPEERPSITVIREEWEAQSKEPWTKRKLINVLAASRLEEMLKTLFAESATFYFCRNFEIVKGHWMDAQWTLGTFLAM